MSIARLVLVIALTSAAAAVPTAAARDIFVDNVNGDDRWDGRTPVPASGQGGPCRTIGRALELARSEDRIVLENTGEPYRESVTLQAGRHSGRPGHPFRVLGNGAVLDGTQPVPRDNWEHVEGDVYRFHPRAKSFQILYLDGRPANRHQVARGAPLPELRPLEWCLHAGAIYFRVEPGRLPREYALTHTADPVGITLYEVRHVAIMDLTVQGFQLDGINAHDGVFDTQLVGLTCRGNGRSGISVGGASRVSILACLVGDNGTAQVRSEGFSETEISNSNLLDASAPAIVRDGGRVNVQ